MDIILFMELKNYLRSLAGEAEREAFAARCGTSLTYLRLIAYNKNGKGKRASAKLAVEIDRESDGAVPVELLCPDVDWAYVRQSARGSA